MLELVGAALEDLAGRRVEGDEDVACRARSRPPRPRPGPPAGPPRWSRGWGRSRPRRRPRSRGPASAATSSARGRPRPRPAGTRRSCSAPAGTTMNSWKSTELSAWAPPLSTFIIGTGSSARLAAAVELGQVAVERLLGVGRGGLGGRERDAEQRVGAEPALVRGAVELDHRPVERALLGRPGPGQRRGDLAVDVGDRPADALAGPGARRRRAARPPRTLRSRRPEGTAASPRAPDSSTTSTSTVGLPRESRIWRAWIEEIVLTGAPVYSPAPAVAVRYSPVSAGGASPSGAAPGAAAPAGSSSPLLRPSLPAAAAAGTVRLSVSSR